MSPFAIILNLLELEGATPDAWVIASDANKTLPGDKFHEFRNEDEAIDWVSSRLNEHSKTYPLS